MSEFGMASVAIVELKSGTGEVPGLITTPVFKLQTSSHSCQAWIT